MSFNPIVSSMAPLSSVIKKMSVFHCRPGLFIFLPECTTPGLLLLLLELHFVLQYKIVIKGRRVVC